jgi:hypothetical protein
MNTEIDLDSPEDFYDAYTQLQNMNDRSIEDDSSDPIELRFE